MTADRERSTESADAGAVGARTTRQVADAAHEAVDRAADNAGQVEQRIRQKAADAEGQLRDRSVEARERSERAVDEFRRYSREKPFATAAIAFAAGLVVSRLLSR